MTVLADASDGHGRRRHGRRTAQCPPARRLTPPPHTAVRPSRSTSDVLAIVGARRCSRSPWRQGSPGSSPDGTSSTTCWCWSSSATAAASWPAGSGCAELADDPVRRARAVWTIGVMFYATTYSWGLPSGDTWTLFSAELDLVREQFHVAVAPVLDGGGWPVLAAIGLAFAVCLADAFAFGALARAEALVPGGVLFVFIAALGADRLAGRTLGGARRRRCPRHGGASSPSRAWRDPGRRPHGTRRVVWQAVATAARRRPARRVRGPAAPRCARGAVVRHPWQRRRLGRRLSPLVDIRSRLTNQTAPEMIVVTSTSSRTGGRRRCQRSTATTWAPADREVAPDADRPSRPTAITAINSQQVRIVGLAGTMIPAAPDPIGRRPDDGDDHVRLRHLDAHRRRRVRERRHVRLDVGAAAIRPGDAARRRRRASPGDPIYLELPDDFPEVAAQTASEVTAGATTPYDKAIALAGLVQVRVQVQPRGPARPRQHGDRGLPARSGRLLRTVRRHVRGDDALARHPGPGRRRVHHRSGDRRRVVHASPAATPTPGRRCGSTTSVGCSSNRRPAAGHRAPRTTPAWHRTRPTSSEAPGPTPTSPETAGSATDPAAAPTTTPRRPAPGGPSTDEGPEPPDAADPAGATDRTVASLAPLFILLAIALASPGRRPTGATACGRADQRREAASPVGPLVVGAARRRRPDPASDTPTEIAHRAAAAFPVVSRPMKSLAEALTEATYRPEGSAGFDVDRRLRVEPAPRRRPLDTPDRTSGHDSIEPAARVRRYFTRWR